MSGTKDQALHKMIAQVQYSYINNFLSNTSHGMTEAVDDNLVSLISSLKNEFNEKNIKQSNYYQDAKNKLKEWMRNYELYRSLVNKDNKTDEDNEYINAFNTISEKTADDILFNRLLAGKDKYIGLASKGLNLELSQQNKQNLSKDKKYQNLQSQKNDQENAILNYKLQKLDDLYNEKFTSIQQGLNEIYNKNQSYLKSDNNKIEDHLIVSTYNDIEKLSNQLSDNGQQDLQNELSKLEEIKAQQDKFNNLQAELEKLNEEEQAFIKPLKEEFNNSKLVSDYYKKEFDKYLKNNDGEKYLDKKLDITKQINQLSENENINNDVNSEINSIKQKIANNESAKDSLTTLAEQFYTDCSKVANGVMKYQRNITCQINEKGSFEHDSSKVKELNNACQKLVKVADRLGLDKTTPFYMHLHGMANGMQMHANNVQLNVNNAPREFENQSTNSSINTNNNEIPNNMEKYDQQKSNLDLTVIKRGSSNGGSPEI